jgi:hypothetical protein
VKDEVTFPEGISDRKADIWEALLAIADAAGGEWPKRARAAAQYLAAVTVTETDTADTDLLAAVRDAFGDDDRLGTEELASRLNGLPDSPWASWNKGNCIRPHNVSKTLKPYKIEPGAIRLSPSSDQKKARLHAGMVRGRLGEIPTLSVHPRRPRQN